MDFATLQTNVENTLLDLPAETLALIPAWINDAIDEAVERHNFRFMQATLDATTAENTRLLIAKPARWKEARTPPWLLWQDGSTTPIAWAPSEADMIAQFAQALPAEGSAVPVDAGRPRFILETADELHVYPYPDLRSQWDNGNYRLRLPYWENPVALSADADENWLTLNAEWYIIHHAAAAGFLFNQDERRAAGYQQMAEIKFQRAKRADKLTYVSDRPVLSARSGSAPTGHTRTPRL